MKTYLTGIGIAVLASTSLAQAAVPKFEAGAYGSYSRAECGIHLEIDEETLIMTVTNNPLSGVTCDNAGKTWVASCDSPTECSFKDIEGNKYVLRRLQDGNFIYGELYRVLLGKEVSKYIRTGKF